MKTMPSLIREISGSDRKLCEQAMKIYASLFESYEWTEHEIEQYGDHLKKNAEAYAKSGRDDAITYDNGDEVENLYHDEEGARWIETKKKDEHTLWLAYIDGVLDTMPSNDPKFTKLKAAYERGDVEEAKQYFDFEDATVTIEFLKKHRQGTTTVYRGAVLWKRDLLHTEHDDNKAVCQELMEISEKFDKMPRNEVRDILLKAMGNQSKRFSSFSTDPDIAMLFAKPRTMGTGFVGFITSMNSYPVVIAAEAEPNDINFAFTAYLGGRHKSYNWQHELVINNLKALQNIRLVYSGFNTERGEQVRAKVHSRALNYALFRVNAGMPVNQAYDNVVPLTDHTFVVTKEGACNLLKQDESGDYSYVLPENGISATPQADRSGAILCYKVDENTCKSIAVDSEGNRLNQNEYNRIEPFNKRGYAIAHPYQKGWGLSSSTIIDRNFNEILDTPFTGGTYCIDLLDEGGPNDPIAVVSQRSRDDKPFFVMPDGSFVESEEARAISGRITAGLKELSDRHNTAKDHIKEQRAGKPASSSTVEQFADAVIGDDQELHESVDAIYRGIFENSATDINVKQIAAQPGTCQQGIVPNENLANDKEPPEDETVAALMQNSYASRFGRGAGSVVNPGRTSLGMWDGTGPQNVNASTDAPAS